MLLFLFSACAVYQYPIVSSELPQSRRNQFILENDSVLITYRFEGDGGYLHMELINKLQSALFIDWSRSALIFDNVTIPFWRDVAYLDGDVYAYSVTGTVSKPPAHDFLPPRGKVVKQLNRVRSNSYPFHPTFPSTPVDLGQGKTRVYRFSRESTPTDFRVYLTLMNESKTEVIQINHDFWISEVYMNQGCRTILWNEANPFYISRSTGAGELFGGMAIGGLIWLYVVAESKASE